MGKWDGVSMGKGMKQACSVQVAKFAIVAVGFGFALYRLAVR